MRHLWQNCLWWVRRKTRQQAGAFALNHTLSDAPATLIPPAMANPATPIGLLD